MSNYEIINGELCNTDNELYHYGVLGMKWGVRRNASRAFKKASTKANKLEKQQMITNLKSAKLRKKALKKSTKSTTDEQYQKARNIEAKANKFQLKSAKLLKKGMKWNKKMEVVFKQVKLSDIDSDSLAVGKKYAYMLMND